MNKNSCLVNINNCNSLNSSVVSSPTVNSIRRNSFYKLTNVLLLLFLVFGSSVVSFGMESQNENEPKEDGEIYIAPRNRYFLVPNMINGISMFFLTNVMDVSEDGMNDKLDSSKDLVVTLLSLLGLNEHDKNYGYDRGDLLIVYLIGNILVQPHYRGIFSVKPCCKIINEGGNCELYFGIGNVPYVGGFLTLAFVCKPTKYLPPFLHDKVTIHIIDLKPFNFILGCVFSTLLIWYTWCDEIYIRPHWIVGFGTVEFKIAKYYNISLNVGSWILDLIMYIKYTKEANEKELKNTLVANNTHNNP